MRTSLLAGAIAAAAAFGVTPAPSPPVPNVVDDPAWLIAASGFCSNLNVVMRERDVPASGTPGDTAGHFIADISFNFYPQTAVKFSDYPHHLATVIERDEDEANALVWRGWYHKNIALLEPTGPCGAAGSQSWGISVFKVEQNRRCDGDETAWEGHPCVRYAGFVSAETSNFANVNEDRFVCQLFVDSGRGDAGENETCGASCHASDGGTPPWNTFAGEFECGNRITYTRDELGRSEAEACRAVANEYPTECGACAPCGQSPGCTQAVWDAMAGRHSCGGRISYLVQQGNSEAWACNQIGAVEFPDVCGACAPSSPPPPPSPPAPPPNEFRCGGAVNAGAANCAAQLWVPTGDPTLPCYAYGGPNDPCALSVTNDAPNAGFYKSPANCTGDVFFLWDEPDTQGRDYAWAARTWLDYAHHWAEELTTLRQGGLRVTTPLLRADAAAANLDEFWAACDEQCHSSSSPAYIDIVAANPFCGDWNKPVGTADGCRGGARYTVESLLGSLRGRPLMMTNWGYLGTWTAEAQVAAIEATDAFFYQYSPVERVYWFGATDHGGNTTHNFLTEEVLAGEYAGRTLGELWAARCSTV